MTRNYPPPVVFVSYQCHQLLTRDNKLSRLRKRNEQVGKVRSPCHCSLPPSRRDTTSPPGRMSILLIYMSISPTSDRYILQLLLLFSNPRYCFQVVHRCYSPSDEEALRSSQYFYERMKGRRSQRVFSDRSVPIKVLTNLIKTAGITSC